MLAGTVHRDDVLILDRAGRQNFVNHRSFSIPWKQRLPTVSEEQALLFSETYENSRDGGSSEAANGRIERRKVRKNVRAVGDWWRMGWERGGVCMKMQRTKCGRNVRGKVRREEA